MWNCTHENARVKERKRIKTTDDDVARNNDVYKMCCRCKPNTTCALFRHFTISYAVRYFRWKIIILARCDKHSLAITAEQIVMCAIFGGNTSENTFALRLNILIDMCSWRKESICPNQAKLWYEPRRALQTYASASGSPTFYKLLTIDLRHEHCRSMCNSLM